MIPLRIRALFAALACSAALLFGSPLIWAQGQGTGPLPGSQPGTYGPPQSNRGAHQIWGGGAPPSISAGCGTGAVITGTDAVFNLLTGTSVDATCTVTFAVSYGKRPVCIVAGETNITSFATNEAGTSVTISGTLDSSRYRGLCIGLPGSQ